MQLPKILESRSRTHFCCFLFSLFFFAFKEREEIPKLFAVATAQMARRGMFSLRQSKEGRRRRKKRPMGPIGILSHDAPPDGRQTLELGRLSQTFLFLFVTGKESPAVNHDSSENN